MKASFSRLTSLISLFLLFAFMIPALIACGGDNTGATTESGADPGTSPETTTGKDPDTTTAAGGSTSAPDPEPTTGTDKGGDEPVIEPGKFEPSDITGLIVNFDASTLKLSDGDKVESWENLAGSGKYNALSYGSDPIFKAESDINGKPGVVFGKNNGLKLENSEGIKIEDVTIIAVVRAKSVESNSDNNLIFDKLATSGGYDHTWYFNINSSSMFNFGWKDTNGAYHDCWDAGCKLNKNTNYILTGVKSGTTGYLYINGNRAGSTQSGTNQVVSNNEAVYIGAPKSFGKSIDGTISQIIMYDHTLDNTETYNVQKYLSDKWGIEINMESFIPDTTELTVKVDGKELRNISIAQTNYKYSLPYGSTAVPTIAASGSLNGEDLELEVRQADSVTGKASVYIKQFDALYTVEFRVLDKEVESLKAPAVTDVKIDDPFWSERLELFAGTTVAYAFEKLENQGALKNFENIIAGRRQVNSTPWEDGLLYETITGAADLLAVYPNDSVKATIDRYIETVYQASLKSENGYLSTHAMMEKSGKHFDETGNARWYHDCYNFGCLAEAGARYYKATGDIKLLWVAVRFAEFIADNYGYGTKADGSAKINMVPSHSLPEETLLQLFVLLRDEAGLKGKLEKYNDKYPLSIDENEYAELVKFWIENRGNMKGRLGSYGAYAQDDMYYFDQVIAEGHAVRANLFYTGMAAAGIEFTDHSYLQSAKILWDDIYYKQMYINGSTGSTANDEAYGGDYQLPNDGYCETCASAALGFFTGYMSLAFEDSKYADTLENIMYNAVLGGIGLEGKSFYYVQPLNSNSNARWAWNDCPCCVPMFLKFVSRLSSYIYAYSDERVYINQFIGNSAALENGVSLKMTCNMPVSGDFTVKVSGRDTTLCIRIPDWADGFSIRVNGADASYKEENGYAVIDVKSGDEVSVSVGMTVRRLYADSKVSADVGRVAIAYGPVLYCVEGIDNKDFANVTTNQNAVVLPVASAFDTKYESDLLGGVTVLSTEALDTSGNTHTATLVPFYARLNRGTTSAFVWLKEKK